MSDSSFKDSSNVTYSVKATLIDPPSELISCFLVFPQHFVFATRMAPTFL